MGGRDRISELPQYLNIWCLAISIDDDMSDSVSYKEIIDASIVSAHRYRMFPETQSNLRNAFLCFH